MRSGEPGAGTERALVLSVGESSSHPPKDAASVSSSTPPRHVWFLIDHLENHAATLYLGEMQEYASPRAPGNSRRNPETPPRQPPTFPALSPALPSNNQPIKAPLHSPLLGLSEPDVGLPLSSGPFYPSDH